uniref:Uncharacterized protein n=1 Tax=Arundo donax TaxID=35708 RepID=A0A0A9BRV2_ARUDO
MDVVSMQITEYAGPLKLARPKWMRISSSTPSSKYRVY